MKLIPAAGLVGVLAIREAATTDLNQIVTMVRAAVQAALDATKTKADSYVWFDVDAIYADSVVVCKDGRHWKYSYTIGDDNVVKLGEPAEVTEKFVAVKAPAREAVVVIADDATGLVRLLEAELGDLGKTWDVIIVRAGLSKNNVFYPDATLREGAPVFEGARVYVKQDAKHLKDDDHDPEKLFGWLSDVKFVEGKSPDTGYLAGTLNVGAQFKDLRETIVDAWKRGKRDLVGLSINAYGKLKKAARAAHRVAETIAKVSSVDLIVNPAAGGALVRMVEATTSQESSAMKEAMLAAIAAKFPQFDAAGKTDAEIMAKYSEAIAADKPAPQLDASGYISRAEWEAREKLREARDAAARKINATTLPDVSKVDLVERFNGLDKFTEAEVDTAIKAERDKVVRLTESLGLDVGKVKLAVGDITVEDRSKRIADMLDAFYDKGHKDHRNVQSFKECYVEITGDRRITGQLEHMDRRVLRESCGVMRESLDTTVLTNVLGAAIRRRLIKDYAANTAWDCWRFAADVVPLADFRTNERTRFGGYGNLGTVNQGQAYPALNSPSDEKATYAATKRGGTEDLTREAIKNDDVGLIRRIPIGLSRAAKRTLCEFVMDFVRTNPAVYDGVAFFHAGHSNLGSAALDATSLAARRLAMKKQAELSSNKRLGVGPANIWLPDDLEETGVNLFARNTNNDKTFVNSLSLRVLPVPYWTDVTDWALSADLMDAVGIEVGFVDGQEEPELFVQDMQNVGSMFTNDKVTWKIRHEYGGNVVDFRAWDKSVVAG